MRLSARPENGTVELVTMKLRLKCTCGTILTADSSLSGKRGRCKKCGYTFTVPVRKASKAKTDLNSGFPMEEGGGWLTEGLLSEEHSSAKNKTFRGGDFAHDRSYSQQNLPSRSNRKNDKTCPECAAVLTPSTTVTAVPLVAIRLQNLCPSLLNRPWKTQRDGTRVEPHPTFPGRRRPA